MVADRRYNRYPVFQRHICVFQQVIGKKCAIFCMMCPVNGISDIVHIPGDFYKLNVMFGIAKPLQNFSGLMCYLNTMGLRMICKSQLSQIGIPFFKIGIDFFIIFYFFISQFFQVSFFHFVVPVNYNKRKALLLSCYCSGRVKFW